MANNHDKRNLQVYTDGSHSPQQGAIGWAAVVKAGSRYKKVNAGQRRRSNQDVMTAELEGVVGAIRYAQSRKASKVTIYCDSAAVVSMVNSTGSKFSKQRSGRCWKLLHYAQEAISSDGMAITVEWVKGHSGNPGNRAADKEAKAARKSLMRTAA